jgi:hypothetical protein
LATTTWAQSWLYAALQPAGNTNFALVEVPLTPTALAAVQRTITIPGRVWSGPVVSFDGRYVVWIGSTPSPDTARRIMSFDRRSGQVNTLPIEVPNGRLFADPTTLRFFLVPATYPLSLLIIESSGVRTVALPDVWSIGPLSSDGAELFAIRRTGSGGSETYRVVVLNPLSGAELRTLPAFSSDVEPVSLLLSRDGQRLYVATSSDRPPVSIRVVDAASGAQFASREFPEPPFIYSSVAPKALDEKRNRVFVGYSRLSGSVAQGSLIVLDGTTLATVGSGGGLSQMVFDHTQSIGVNAVSGSFYHGCSGLGVETWGASTEPMSVIATGLSGVCVSLALAVRPDAPGSASVDVSARRVTLNWSAVLGASDYVVEAGLEPGRPILAHPTGGMTQLVVNDVPPGTYYVRVRAVNEVGVGAASSELVVGISP